MTESMGYKSQMAINPVSGGMTLFNASSVRLEFLSQRESDFLQAPRMTSAWRKYLMKF
jgi:hypothetical protein